MKLVSLRVEGYGPFRDARLVEFPPGGVFTLVGPNGAGKSTLLDAVAYSLFAQVARPGITARELIPDGVNAATFELSIVVDGRQLTVWRKLPAAKTAAVQAQLVEHTVAGDVNLAAGQEAVTARLEQELGLAFPEFVRTVLLAQGQTAEFLLGDRARRRDVLDRLLDLSVYGRLADAAGRARDEARAALGAAHARLGEHSPERADVVAAEEALAAAIARQHATLGHERAARDRAADRIEAEAAERGAADRLAALATARADWDTASSMRHAAEQGLAPQIELAAAASAARVAAEAARGDARAGCDAVLASGPDTATCEAARGALARIEATAAEIDALGLGRLADAARAAADEEAAARTAHEGRALAAKAANMAAAEAVRVHEDAGRATGERARLVVAIREAGADEAAVARDLCADRLEAARAARTEAEAAASRAHAEHAAAHLRIGLAPGDPCPVCDQPVPLVLPAGPAHAQAALDAVQRASDAARADEEAAAHALAEAEGRVAVAAAAVAAAEAALATLPPVADLDAMAARATHLVEVFAAAEAEAVAAAEQSRAASARHAAALTAHQAAAISVARAEERLAADSAVLAGAAVPASADPETYLAERVAELTRVAAAAAEAQTALDAAYAAEREALAAHDAASRNVRDALAKSDAASAALAALAAAAGVSDRDDVGAAADAAEATWQRAIDDARAALKEARAEEATAFAALGLAPGDEAGLARVVGERAREVGIAEAGVETARRERHAIRAATEEVAAAEIDSGWWEELAKDLAGNRLHDYVARRAAQVLSARASEWLLDLTGGRYELRYQQHGANSSFAVLDRHTGSAPRNAATLSGGERFVAALAVALGLAAVAADRARLETLLIDEGFGALDDDRLDAVREALERLAVDGGRLVGVVTHLPDLAEEVGTRIDVTALPPG